MQGFSKTQLDYFSVTQAAVITSGQYQSLDYDKQEVIRQKLSTIQADLLSNPTEGGNAGDAGISGLLISCCVRLLFYLCVFTA